MVDVIAFDVDGALTEQKGIELFKKFRDGGDIVGIVSARPKDNVMDFIVENNISPDFMRSTPFKGTELRKIRQNRTGENYIYYGSWLRDRIHATIAGWEYEQL